MKRVITRHQERRARMRFFFAEPASVALLQPHADIVADVAQFVADDDAWEALALELHGRRQNATAQTKAAAVKMMAETVTRWGQRCLKRMRQLGLLNEAAILARQVWEIVQMPTQEGITVAKTMRQVLADHQAQLTMQGVTAAVIADMDAKIGAAEAASPMPVEMRKEMVALNRQLQEGNGKLERALAELVDTIHAEFRYTDVDFDRALLTFYKLHGDTAKRHTGLEGTAKTAAGMALAGYVVRRADKPSKQAVVDREGGYEMKEMRSGEVVFELVDAAGLVVGQQVVKLKQGGMVGLDWVV